MKRAVAFVLLSTTAAAFAEVAPPPKMPVQAGFRAPGPRRPPTPPPPPAPPAPAPEIAQLGGATAGTYKCKGVQLRGDGSSTPLEASVTIKLDLDNAWIQASLVSAQTKWTEYRTYDGVAKQWTRVQLTNAGAHVIATSLGERNGTWTWEGTASSPAGTLQLRDYEQLAKKSIKVWGEALQAGSWQKTYEATCTR